MTSSSGINLQVASSLIFLDPVGNSRSQGSSLEQQAIGNPYYYYNYYYYNYYYNNNNNNNNNYYYYYHHHY